MTLLPKRFLYSVERPYSFSCCMESLYKEVSSVTSSPQGQKNTGLEGVTLRDRGSEP